MNKFKEIFTKDTRWKLLSLAIAFCLWFIVINIENPTESRNFTVNLTVNNKQYAEQNEKVLMNLEELEAKRVPVRVTAKRIELEKMSTRDLTAFIDLADIDMRNTNGMASLPIKIKIGTNSNVTAEPVSESSVIVEIENRISAEFPVEVWFGGDKDSDINVINQSVDPVSVMVTGAESVVNGVTSVRAVINLENTYDGQTVNVPLGAYNAEGEIVEGVVLSRNDADAVIRFETSRNIPVRTSAVGEAAQGCSLVNLRIEPEYITVHGNPDVINDLIYIDLPAIDINGASEDIEKSFVAAVFLPSGLRAEHGNNDIVKVTAEITGEKETKVAFDSDNIEIRGELAEGLEAVIEKDSYNIEVLGNTFNRNYMKVYVDVTGLEAGEHRLEINMELNGDGKLVGNEPYATVIIKEKTPVEEEEIPVEE